MGNLKLKEIKADGWVNDFIGIGNDRDKMSATWFGTGRRISDTELDRIFHGEPVAELLCGKLIKAALAKGFDVHVDTESDMDVEEIERSGAIEKDIHQKLRSLKFSTKYKEAVIWSKVFGASVLVLGADDGGELAEPLNVEKIKTFSHLQIFDRRYVVPIRWYTDFKHEKYGEPEVYRIYSTPSRAPGAIHEGIDVHESRLVVINGTLSSVSWKQEHDGWPQSMLERLDGVLKGWGISWGMLYNLMSDAPQAVYKMQDLIGALEGQNEDVVKTRMQLVDMNRSGARALCVDAETEEFVRADYDWTDIDKPFDLLMHQMAMVMEIPVTILMERSPAGQNATGESDFKNWDDTVTAYQDNEVAPVIEHIVEVYLQSQESPTGGTLPDSWEVSFKPLRKPEPKDESATRKAIAEADKIYYEIGALTPEEIGVSRFTRRGWSMETRIDTEARAQAYELNPYGSEGQDDGAEESGKPGQVAKNAGAEGASTGVQSGSGEDSTGDRQGNQTDA